MSRVVLITGCSTGIGRATAQYLAQRGWFVFASARRVQDICDLEGERTAVLRIDVTEQATTVRAIEQILNRAGRLDAVVNNAGINVGGPLELVSLEDARLQFETNVWGALLLTQLAVPIMRRQGGGRIVNISSVMAKVPLPFSGLYNASKVALEAISDTLRWELTPWNIYVSVIEPGSVISNVGKTARAFRMRFIDDPLYGRYLRGDRHARAGAEPIRRRWPIITTPRQILAHKPPLQTAKVIEHALEDAHPRPRYKAGLDTHIYMAIRSLLPDALFDYAIERAYGFREKHSSVSSKI